MAQQIQDSPKKKKKPPKQTAFLSCFGFSGHRDDYNLPSGKAKPPPPSAGKRRRRWYFSLSLCRKQKSASKTVPLADAAVAAAAGDEQVNRSREIHVVKSDGGKKTSSKSRQAPAAELPVPGVKTTKASRYDKTDNIIIDKTKTFDLTNHKKASKKNNISAGPTPEKAVLSRASSAGKSQKKKKPAGADPERSIDSTKNQDFIYGMSILMVILIIMLLWGRLCAIVCTAAWFYTVPRTGKNQEPEIGPENGSRVANGVVHFSSAERKKKVVLDGFLERNHRTTIIL